VGVEDGLIQTVPCPSSFEILRVELVAKNRKYENKYLHQPNNKPNLQHSMLKRSHK